MPVIKLYTTLKGITEIENALLCKFHGHPSTFWNPCDENEKAYCDLGAIQNKEYQCPNHGFCHPVYIQFSLCKVQAISETLYHKIDIKACSRPYDTWEYGVEPKGQNEKA